MNFTELEKLMRTKGINSLAEIARVLDTTPQAVSNWKARNQVPHHVVNKVLSEHESNVNKQEIDNQVKDSALFDMKLLNGIDDKVARGTAKKVYIGCKKDDKSSAEVIEEIKNSISSAGLMNENVEKILKEQGYYVMNEQEDMYGVL